MGSRSDQRRHWRQLDGPMPPEPGHQPRRRRARLWRAYTAVVALAALAVWLWVR